MDHAEWTVDFHLSQPRRWHIPCPKCGGWHLCSATELYRLHEGKDTTACRHCKRMFMGKEVADAHRQGRWMTIDESPDPDHPIWKARTAGEALRLENFQAEKI